MPQLRIFSPLVVGFAVLSLGFAGPRDAAADSATSGHSVVTTYAFVPLGRGGCRTPENTQGNYYRARASSLKDCQRRCSAAIGSSERCYGIEYDRESGNCELHRKFISHATGSGGVVCYKTLERKATVCPKCD